jgi:hypothetical protein
MGPVRRPGSAGLFVAITARRDGRLIGFVSVLTPTFRTTAARFAWWRACSSALLTVGRERGGALIKAAQAIASSKGWGCSSPPGPAARWKRSCRASATATATPCSSGGPRERSRSEAGCDRGGRQAKLRVFGAAMGDARGHPADERLAIASVSRLPRRGRQLSRRSRSPPITSCTPGSTPAPS